MNRNSKVVNMNKEPQLEAQVQYPELFTEQEVTDYGEIVSTTKQGQIFVLKDDQMHLFQPVATHHFNKSEYYYNKVEFK